MLALIPILFLEHISDCLVVIPTTDCRPFTRPRGSIDSSLHAAALLENLFPVFA